MHEPYAWICSLGIRRYQEGDDHSSPFGRLKSAVHVVECGITHHAGALLFGTFWTQEYSKGYRGLWW